MPVMTCKLPEFDMYTWTAVFFNFFTFHATHGHSNNIVTPGNPLTGVNMIYKIPFGLLWRMA